jgi:hypothetical protein
MPSVRFHQFLLPKSGYTITECEDAISVNMERGKFGLADGATEAFDSRTWAMRLATSWAQTENAPLTQEEFRAWVAEEGRALHDSWNGLKLSWYAEEKARGGSFAAFVGVELDFHESTPRWRTVALGDACFLHCRRDQILRALPLSDSRSFTAAPYLVPSHASMQDEAFARVHVDSGNMEQGDVLMLLSDAASAWYLMLAETEDEMRARFDLLMRAGEDEELARLFEAERVAGRIKDDDVAVIRVEL